MKLSRHHSISPHLGLSKIVHIHQIRRQGIATVMALALGAIDFDDHEVGVLQLITLAFGG